MRRCVTALLSIVLLAASFAPIHGAAASGEPMIFGDPPVVRVYSQVRKYGLMTAQGEVLVPAEYSSAYALYDEEGNRRGFALYRQSIGRGGEAGAMESALCGPDGRLLSTGAYEQYSYLPGGMFAASRAQDGGMTVDLLDEKGSVIKKNFADYARALGKGALIGQRFLKDGTMEVIFYDASLEPVNTRICVAIDPYLSEPGAPELFPICVAAPDLLYGYVDARGEMVIEPQFGYAFPFSIGGYAEVSDGAGKCGIIDAQGNAVFMLAYDVAGYGSGFFYTSNSSGVALYNSKRELITGDDQYDDQYEDVSLSGAGDPVPIAIVYRADGLADVYSPNGERLAQGIAAMREMPLAGIVPLSGQIGGREYLSGLYDVQTGKTVAMEGMYAHLSEEGRVVVQGDTSAMLYDTKGNILYEAESVAYVRDGVYRVAKTRFRTLLYGLIDRDGNELLPVEYSALYSATDDASLFGAQRGGEMGYITTDGTWIARTSAYALLAD